MIQNTNPVECTNPVRTRIDYLARTTLEIYARTRVDFSASHMLEVLQGQRLAFLHDPCLKFLPGPVLYLPKHGHKISLAYLLEIILIFNARAIHKSKINYIT